MSRTHPIEVLFDYGAKHSFISARLVQSLLLVLTSRHSLLSIALSDGKALSCPKLFIDWPIKIHAYNIWWIYISLN